MELAAAVDQAALLELVTGHGGLSIRGTGRWCSSAPKSNPVGRLGADRPSRGRGPRPWIVSRDLARGLRPDRPAGARRDGGLSGGGSRPSSRAGMGVQAELERRPERHLPPPERGALGLHERLDRGEQSP